MSRASLFRLIALTGMLLSYAFEKRSRGFILSFAASWALGSAFGFLQGAYPFSLVDAVWSVEAVRRWWAARRGHINSQGKRDK